MIKYRFVKRIIDIILSTASIMLLWPVFIIIAAAIRFDSKGPVFFIQRRLGKGGREFKIIKFRTMVDGAVNMNGGIFTNETDPRITKAGRFLRKTSIDELPQIINILKGDMSIVGPRPPVPHHPMKYEQYDEIQKRRFDVRPGITGYAQVKVRNNVPWADRILLDIQYVDNMCFRLDCCIFLRTFVAVLKRENIYLTPVERELNHKA